MRKDRKRFQARIRIGRKQISLGTYDTLQEAALAYDRAVVQHKLSSSRLNFPNDYTTSSEDDESSEEESDDNSSNSGSDNDASDDEAIQPTTIKEEPEAELILNKAEEEVHVKSEPEAEF